MVRKSVIRPSVLSLKIVYNLFVNKSGITVNDLARNLKTDYKNVYDCVDSLFKEGVIKKEKIGNYNICKLNYSNEDIVESLKEYNFYIKVKEFRKKYPDEYRIIVETCGLFIKEYGHLFICLVFGSYAKGEENKNSDLDLLFLVGHSSYSFDKEIKKILSKKNSFYQKNFHLIHQTIAQFTKDLKKIKELSIATEIYKEPSIVLYGDDIFFKIMVEANQLW